MMSVRRKFKIIFLTSKRCQMVIPGHKVSLKRETISPDDPQEKYFSHNVAIFVRRGRRRCQDFVSGIRSIVHDVSG